MSISNVFTPFFVALALATAALGSQGIQQGWTSYEKGFATRAGEGKSGGPALFCENAKTEEVRGARNAVALNQKEATPFVVTAWSKAANVSGGLDDGYSLYLDLNYVDGGHLWGTMTPFATGTHGWQQRRVRVCPTKPVKEVLVYVLLRGHTGQAWFSDVAVGELGGKSSFDFQPIQPPKSTTGRWFVRDVASNSGLMPVSKVAQLGLRAKVSLANNIQTLQVVDKRGVDRALTLYYCEKVDAAGGRWWNSIRNTKPIGVNECATVTNASSGANGLSSTYPFAAITSDRVGRMLAIPPTIGPRPIRMFYHPGSKLFCAAFDVALTKANKLHPSEADAQVVSAPIDPAWGLRDAARQYYAAFPDAYRNRITKQGIWMPFTSPGSLPHPEDFGFGVHEGDNSVERDAALGILSFRYTEPMTWWMVMAPSIPRTYQDAMTILQKNLKSPEAATRKQAEAVLTSGTFGPDGRLNVSFQNQPWANGAVWILNPNPALPRPDGKAIQADVVFGAAEAKARYASSKLSGEYLDSLEAHAEILDYRPESLAASSLPPSFDEESKRPVIPQSYSTFEIARSMSSRLHGMGKLLFANTTPLSYPSYMPLMDCAGTEVNWLDADGWSPDNDDVFCYRRTLCYHKPYMLLQNTNFAKFGSKEVELYFKKCLFYGVFPSFFSADAATNPYWENPALYNRDRPLFKSTIPLIRTLAEAGWEPITRARTNAPQILIERYGENLWTVFNEGKVAADFTVRFDAATSRHAEDAATGEPLPLFERDGHMELDGALAPGDCRVIRLKTP